MNNDDALLVCFWCQVLKHFFFSFSFFFLVGMEGLPFKSWEYLSEKLLWQPLTTSFVGAIQEGMGKKELLSGFCGSQVMVA